MASLKQALGEVHAYNVNSATREMYIHSYYSDDGSYEEPGVDFRQATTFIKNLHILDRDPFEPILIHLHSIGGCWQNGMAMFNMIEFCRSPIKMIAYSQASSMSGIILQASPLRIMLPDTHFMMHQGTSGGSVNHPIAVQSDADFQVKGCRRMLEIFAKRAVTGEFFSKKKSNTVENAYRFFDKKIKDKVDWFLTAEESLYYGLCDGILGSKEYPDVHCIRPV